MTSKDSVPVRQAATVLLVRDDPFQVLMVERHAKAFHGSAMVFPGGVVEKADWAEDWLPYLQGGEGLDAAERAARVAACREMFEEAAVLLATVSAQDVNPALGFFEMISVSGGKLRLDALTPFAHWITPIGVPKRFDTRFYVCHAPEGHDAVCDGVETVSLEWLTPAAAVELPLSGPRMIAFPTKLNLQRLAESANAQAAIDAARMRPAYVTQPVMLQTERGPRVRIPAEAGYAVTEGLPIGH
ncbi:NUDIX hydrolase [Acidocella aquatica]|uniref:NUDIX hydrolase n=1 Tax=Acidocella aquatica TaxID=1922313 RepID=A0ABQ6A1M6_9PROT|nr:NUDIX domain-containing protein [Acidocella aquatica]GLR65513.1 NUDIX hydrolase [Acidocella aquatica]